MLLEKLKMFALLWIVLWWKRLAGAIGRVFAGARGRHDVGVRLIGDGCHFLSI